MLKKIAFVLMFLASAISDASAAKEAEKPVPVVQAPVAEDPQKVEAMVMLDNKPLFPIKVKIFSFSPADRANTISDRLSRFARESFLNAEDIKVVDGDTTSDIIIGDKVLMSITDADALAAGKSRSELAKEDGQILKNSISQRSNDYSLRSIGLGAIYAVLASLVLFMIFSAISRFIPRLITKIESWKGTYLQSFKLLSIEVVHQDRIISVVVSVIKLLRVIAVLVLLNIYIPLVLSFFPWTHDYSTRFMDYIVNPVHKIGKAFFDYLPNVFVILIIVLATYYVIKFAKFLFSEVEKGTITLPGFYPEWAVPTFNIIRFLIIVFALVVVFPYLPGSDSPAFKGVSVFLGVLISLGSSSAISNVVAGVILTYTRAFKHGDRIQIGDTNGDVMESNLLVTRIRTIKNVDITVPNSMVLSSHISNFSAAARDEGLILNTTVTIGYDAPWRQVHELLISAATATKNILEVPAPFVFQTSLDDFFVSYQINAYTDKPSVMAVTYSELHKNIQEKFNEGGVEIMSPHYAAHRDGNMTTIPESYLPGTYKPPTFKFSSTDN